MATAAAKLRAAQSKEAVKLHKALSHELRSQMLYLIMDRPMSPNELARELDLDINRASYHVKVLKDHDLIELIRTEPRRGAVEHYYRANTRHYVGLREAQEMHPASADRYAGNVYAGGLSDFLEAADAGTLKPQENLHLSVTRLVFSEDGYEKVIELLDELQPKLEALSAKSVGELAKSGEPSVAVSAQLFFFKMPDAAKSF